jgi:hypothetical protein
LIKAIDKGSDEDQLIVWDKNKTRALPYSKTLLPKYEHLHTCTKYCDQQCLFYSPGWMSNIYEYFYIGIIGKYQIGIAVADTKFSKVVAKAISMDDEYEFPIRLDHQQLMLIADNKFEHNPSNKRRNICIGIVAFMTSIASIVYMCDRS